MQCRSSSVDLGCYEFSSGFDCGLEDGHEGDHTAELFDVPGGGPLWRVQWRQLRRWDSDTKTWVEI